MRVLETGRKQHLLTAAEYMTLEIRDRTELLGGVIYDVSPRKEPHRFGVEVLGRALNRGLGDEYSVRIRDDVAVRQLAREECARSRRRRSQARLL